MEPTTLAVEVDGTRGRITLDRPGKLNPLSTTTLAELAEAARWFDDEHPQVKVVVVSGSGRAFSAGADLGAFSGGDGASGATATRAGAELGRRMADGIEAMRAVTIAAIRGHCVGGGLVLASACDLRIAASSTRFAIPELDLGIPLTWGGIPRLVRDVGPAMTKELVMTCRPFDAVEAKAIGFLNRVPRFESWRGRQSKCSSEATSRWVRRSAEQSCPSTSPLLPIRCAMMAGVAGSIRQRGKQSWEVRAFVGKDPATGKKQYVTKTIRGERREAEVALGRMLGEIEDGQYAVRAGTVGDLCEKWFAQAEPDLSPSVGPEYRRLLDNRILPRWGNVPLRRLRTADLDLWYAELRRKGAVSGGPLAPNSVMRIHSVLRRALGQGVKWGWISMNPAANASPPRARKQQLNLPDPADVGRLIEAASTINSSLPTYFRLAAATGARRGEICALRWKHVDFDRRRLTIARGIVEAGGELIEKDTKTHQVRSVSLDEETAAILLAHQDRCTELASKCGTDLSPTSYLFSHEVDFSKPWRPGYATLAFGRLRDELGLKGVKLHHLRHFSATQLLSLGIDIRTVSGRLGHANASTTLDIYAQFVEQADEHAAAALGALLRPTPPAE